MDKSDRRKFAGVMNALAINSGIKLNDEVTDLYFNTLKAFDIEQIEAGAMKILRSWKWNRMPPLAELMDAIEGPQQKITDQAEIECNKVIEYLNIHGGQRPPVFKDPITQHLMTQRWKYQKWASNVLESEITWWRKEFKEAYQAYAADPDTKLITAPEKLKQLFIGKSI